MRDPNIIPRFSFWDPGTWAIPKLYWDAFSQEQRIHAICKQLAKIIGYADYISNQVNENTADIAELQDMFEKFMESGFDDYYAEQIERWVNENLAYLYETLVKQVFFGLTLDGHFVAYIPESWNDIVFDTGADYSLDTYGRLILRWNVSGGSNVLQIPEVTHDTPDYEQMYTYIYNMMNTLYSPEG